MKVIVLLLSLVSPLLAAENLLIPSTNDALKLVGKGRLTYFGFHVYDASTWSPTGQSVPTIESLTFPFALQIRYAREIEAKDLLSKTRDAWLELNMSEADVKQWLAELKNLWPDVKENDVIVCYVDQNEVAEFFVNGKSSGKVQSPQFAKAFLAIWLHQNAEFRHLQQQLAGVVR